MTNASRLLVVDDDPEIRSLLVAYLAREGYHVDAAADAAGFDAALARSGPPDLVLLDLMLPGEDGLSICRRFRAAHGTPVIMLTARGEDVDRIVGLEIGADDYLPKPFNPRELLARIRAVLRRADAAPRADGPAAGRRLLVGSLTVDLDARRVSDPTGEPLALTSAEYELFQCFVTRPGRVLTRDQLMDWTRGRRAEAFDRTVDVQLSRLRKKIDAGGSEPLIITVRGAGYMLTADVRADAPGGG